MSTSSEVIRADEAGVTTRQEFGGTEVARQAETAMAAVQAQQRAMIEARFVMALKRPRNWANIRANVLQLCKTTDFAAEALYVKPIARTPEEWQKWSKQERLQHAPADWPRGFSIRFIEAVLFEAGNFDCPTMVIWEDEDKRMTLVTVTDLERNSSYSRTITTEKTIERRNLKKGQTARAVRQNSYGDMIYIVDATTDEVASKEAAAVSKSIRTLGEKLLPPHYKAEWRRVIEETIANKAVQDPEAAKKEIQDAFFKIGVPPSELEKYLGHPMTGMTPNEFVELRGVYVAVAAADCTWAEALQAKHGELAPAEQVEETEAQKKLKARIEAQKRKAEPAPAPQAGNGGTAPQQQQTPGTSTPGTSTPTAQPTAPTPTAAPTTPTTAPPAGPQPARFATWDEFNAQPDDYVPASIYVADVLYVYDKASSNYVKAPTQPEPQPPADKPKLNLHKRS